MFITNFNGACITNSKVTRVNLKYKYQNKSDYFNAIVAVSDFSDNVV